MMGSPDSEIERFSDEDYHHVTLTKGFWLADTTVTQKQWLSVIGENPSEFKSNERNPVENVSYEDAEHFIDGLREQIDRLTRPYILQMPSEAQWEYACRAGTTTPFSFGENIRSEQVNYNATSPYNNASKGEFRGKTLPVKSLPPNQWGLYEMHGNVNELCADSMLDSLGKSAVVNPYQPVTQDTLRVVVRSGGWDDDGEFVRSACRYDRPAEEGSDVLGFRLSLGHELKSSKLER